MPSNYLKNRLLIYLNLIFLAHLWGCTNLEELHNDDQAASQPALSEKITRHAGEYLYTHTTPTPTPPITYPWTTKHQDHLLPITKDYFRCKGSLFNPMLKLSLANGGLQHLQDCGGTDTHGLPMRHQKEFVYPILVDLLNYIQKQSGKQVIITCGHRCPAHSQYADPDVYNKYSKHMLAAEVDFYLEDIQESDLQSIIQWIKDYYTNSSEYSNKPEYLDFARYQKQDLNVSTPPWYNKEIFIKLYLPEEGRDLDNRHQYPYFGIQVRYDRQKNERVSYNWTQARSYLRK